MKEKRCENCQYWQDPEQDKTWTFQMVGLCVKRCVYMGDTQYCDEYESREVEDE